jgi:hypothetical protein
MDVRVSEASAASMFSVKEWAVPDEVVSGIGMWAPEPELGTNFRSEWPLEGLLCETTHDHQQMQTGECTFADWHICHTARHNMSPYQLTHNHASARTHTHTHTQHTHTHSLSLSLSVSKVTSGAPLPRYLCFRPVVANTVSANKRCITRERGSVKVRKFLTETRTPYRQW